jgi:RNA polymerase sigma-70 factor (ECF subfamily)
MARYADVTDASFRQFQCSLIRFAQALLPLRLRAEAEDVVQDTFLKLLRRGRESGAASQGGMLHLDMPRYGYLKTAVRNGCYSLLRRERPMEECSDTQWSQLPSLGCLPGTPLEDYEQQTRLLAALDQLTTREHSVCILAFVEKLPYEEIAQTLNQPLGTVCSTINRARRRLAPLLFPPEFIARWLSRAEDCMHGKRRQRKRSAQRQGHRRADSKVGGRVAALD